MRNDSASSPDAVLDVLDVTDKKFTRKMPERITTKKLGA